MNRELRPSSIAPPAANYAHGVHVQSPSEWVFTSGVVPANADGTVPPTVAEQADLVWANISAILDDAGLSTADVVSVTTYVVATELTALPGVMGARDRALGGRRAASTLVTVPALARPEWRVEIAVVAAR